MTVALLGKGVYTYRQAARLTNLRPARVREWFGRQDVFKGDYKPVGEDRAISFLDLVDVFVAGHLRSAGVSMQTVRKVYAKLSKYLDADHPFCRKELLTDGKSVFSHYRDEDGFEFLVDVLSDQGVFPSIILPFLKTIEYHQRLARRWKIAPAIVVDPAICFGAPVVEAAGVPTEVLARAFKANGNDAAAVASFYGVDSQDVLDAVGFESTLAA